MMARAVRLLGGDQGPFRDQRFADAAGDRGRDPGIIEIDPGILQCRLGGGDFGHGLLPAGLNVDLLLFAHRLGADQHPVSVGLQPG